MVPRAPAAGRAYERAGKAACRGIESDRVRYAGYSRDTGRAMKGVVYGITSPCARTPLRLLHLADAGRRRLIRARCQRLRQTSAAGRLVEVEAVSASRNRRGIVLR